MTTYKYPLNVSDVGLYLQFKAYDYQSTPQVGNKDIKSAIGSNVPISTTDSVENLGSTVTTAIGSTTGGTTSSAVDKGSVFLYLPPKLEFSYGAEWQKVQFGALGSAFGSGNIGEALGQAAKIGTATAANVLGDSVADALTNVPKVQGVDLDNVLGAAFGVTFNDNTIQTFEKMQLRDFSYDYLLVARNKTEETEIKKIVKFFKSAMHPASDSNTKNNTIFLKYPYVFRIMPSGYRNNVSVRKDNLVTPSSSTPDISSFFPATRYCGMTKFDVSYTPDNVLSLTPGGFVTAVRISMQFSELTALTREDLDEFEDPIDLGNESTAKTTSVTSNQSSNYSNRKRWRTGK